MNPSNRPFTVNLACIFLGLRTVIAIVFSYLIASKTSAAILGLKTGSPVLKPEHNIFYSPLSLTITAIYLVIVILLIIGLLRGVNWVRIATIILAIFSAVMNVFSILGSKQFPTLAQKTLEGGSHTPEQSSAFMALIHSTASMQMMAGMVGLLLAAAVLVVLLTKSSKNWFKKPAKA